jgi:hypothetical protein
MLTRLTEWFVVRVLCSRNISWVDPKCGCTRSPDSLLSSPCPDGPDHPRSTRQAFSALDLFEMRHGG